MSPNPPAGDLNTVLIVGIAIPLAWYAYQVASRKREWIRYKIKRVLVALAGYLAGATLLAPRHLPPLEIILMSGLAGLGAAWVLVPAPRGGRRIPKTVRQKVIARDLTSKGLKWDPAKHHIDHIVPFSRGGDNSPRNLRVVEKEKNLRKGGKMPSFWDLLGK